MDTASDIRGRLGDLIGDRTLAAFAAEVGVSPASVSRWLAGETSPSRRLAVRIVRRYPELRGVLLDQRLPAAS